jgi:anaerobic ribonucleoside-triphosphate reductase activating protein
MIFPVDQWMQPQTGHATGDARIFSGSPEADLRAQALKIGGFIPTTTVDFPGHLAAVIFTQGCPWRCGYCHNSHLTHTPKTPLYEWDAIYTLLERRRHLLDGVVFSGGEPTIQRGLISAANALTDLDYAIALHTGGPDPDKFKNVLHFVDWIGLDIKAMPDDYPNITGVANSGRGAWKSLQILLESDIAHEVRTTVHWSRFTPQSLLQLGRALANMGVENYVVQLARCDSMLNPEWGDSYPPESTEALWSELRALFRRFECRRS